MPVGLSAKRFGDVAWVSISENAGAWNIEGPEAVVWIRDLGVREVDGRQWPPAAQRATSDRLDPAVENNLWG